jgi:asparagine synthase (glutamine-hydrolysing)
MCGIAGFTHRGVSGHRDLILKITKGLTHRGPDQQDVFTTPHVCLGAVRLKIIDLAGGNQPIVSDDGNTAIVFNGEIYNHQVLRAELESKGHKFRSNCDTEVVLRGFLEWDTQCFERLHGMFGVALWSERDQRLVLARDRVGIKPLYYSRAGQNILFGSELKAILAHPDVCRKLDLDALQDYLSLNYVPGENTLVDGIKKLRPGHLLECRHGKILVRPYWQIRFAPDHSMDLEGAKSELNSLLRNSVREHMLADVPLGVWASGGLDSSAVLHYAAEASSRRLKTFSIAFDSGCCDESRYFREIARVYGTDHHEFRMSSDQRIPEAVEELAEYSDEPGADAGALPVWFLSKMSRSHVTVALSGDGGDELFGGYLTYHADRLARPLRRVPALVRRTVCSAANYLIPVSQRKIGFEYKLKRMLEGSLLPPDESHLFWNGSFSQEQKARLLPGLEGHDLERLSRQLPSASDVGFANRYMLLDQNYYLPDNILYKVDRMSMAHSLEVRPPLLDHRIVEFAARLPERLKLRGSTGKYLLKETLRGKLPDAIIDRPKSGFDIPAHAWFRGILKPLLYETLTPGAVASTGIFEPAATERLIRDHMNERINAGYQLWGLVTLFLWLKKWRIQVPPPQPPSPHAQETPAAALAATT